jgi:hypothetical protein
MTSLPRPTPDPATWTPEQWRIWLAGYTRGVESGAHIGYADADADMAAAWAQTAATIRAIGRRPGPLGPPRSEYTTPAETAAEIHARARASWQAGTP